MNPDYLNWVRLNKISGKGHNFKIMVMDHKLTSHCPLADLSSFWKGIMMILSNQTADNFMVGKKLIFNFLYSTVHYY